MSAFRSVLPIALLLLPIGCSREETKATNQEKIIGVWTLIKSTRSSTPPGNTTWEFTKDGEIIVTDKTDEGPLSIEGKYAIEKGVLRLEPPIAMAFTTENPSTIKKLTDTDLIFEAEMDGKNDTIELKRKK